MSSKYILLNISWFLVLEMVFLYAIELNSSKSIDSIDLPLKWNRMVQASATSMVFMSTKSSVFTFEYKSK